MQQEVYDKYFARLATAAEANNGKSLNFVSFFRELNVRYLAVNSLGIIYHRTRSRNCRWLLSHIRYSGARQYTLVNVHFIHKAMARQEDSWYGISGISHVCRSLRGQHGFWRQRVLLTKKFYAW